MCLCVNTDLGRGRIFVTGTFVAVQASTLAGHLTNMVIEMSGLPGLLCQATSQGPGMFEYEFLLLPDDPSQANTLVSVFFQTWTPGELLSKLTSKKDADSSLGGVALTQAKLDSIQQAFQLSVTPEPTITSLTTTRSKVAATTTTVTVFNGSSTFTTTSTLTSVSDTATTTIHTTTSSHATTTVSSTTSATATATSTASTASETHTDINTRAVTHETIAQGVNVASNAAVDTASEGSGDVEIVLIYVLTGASLAVLISACAGAAFFSCRSVESEKHLDLPRTLHVFRTPIQRVQSMVSVRSFESPRVGGRSFPTGTYSVDSFFCRQLPGAASALKQLAKAAEAGHELGGPRAPSRFSLQGSARSTSPAPAPPRIPPGASSITSVPGAVGEP
ncbi:unnamed protein product [Prorocentrum cordatum]|uniref:Mucin-5AC-like n=1 Tax=Prorocentrum cordatum TaxID=2364126 RepID=A0ABN9S1N0_9DINO|nr:unnamed protein product [Polarella glacialis]